MWSGVVMWSTDFVIAPNVIFIKRILSIRMALDQYWWELSEHFNLLKWQGLLPINLQQSFILMGKHYY
jgi:hypothetical protein